MVNGWEVASAASGVIYFTAWSASFYPQLLLNHRRNRYVAVFPSTCLMPLLSYTGPSQALISCRRADNSALGVSPDFVAVNPIGFFCLSVWSFGAYFSSTARRQYQDRHDGHLPQVSKSDLAFSAHALLLSSLTFVQSAWLYYRAHQRRQNPVPAAEETALLGERRKDDETAGAPVMPLPVTRIALLAMAAATVYKVTATAMGHTQLLDLLYFASSLKISAYRKPRDRKRTDGAVITTLKYVPQLMLNYRLKSVRGFAIGTILLVCLPAWCLVWLS